MIHNVLDYGAKGEDDTALIQKAVDAAQPGDSVYVPEGIFYIDGLKGANNFVSGGVFLKSDITFQIRGILQVIPNKSDHYTILTAHDCQNLVIVGGSIIGDRDKHPQDPGKGQWGFGIAIWGGSNITLHNVTISKLWGDGLTVIDGKNILVDHAVVDGCRRQNMSVIGVDGFTLTNSTFKNAQYSALDFEADLEAQSIKNVVVRWCNFVNSVEGPAHIGIGSPVGTYKNIHISDCQFDLKMQPIFAHDRAGNTGTPWWAFLLNRIFYQGLHSPTYRFVGYPTSWSSA